nr:MraZ N-terminal domain-containing protein [uncultured Fretibacterium sp.]
MGTFEHRLDTKARLVLPAKFRERLGDTLVAAIGMEHCVSLYSRELHRVAEDELLPGQREDPKTPQAHPLERT